ncbi:MAG: UDP-N-acetyl glucosamine 2-epimerase [Planctomycetota bacterium]
MDWAVVAGARPQFVKAAALMPVLRARGDAALIHTGQHTDKTLVEDHFADLGLDAPDVSLQTTGGNRATRLASMVDRLAAVFEERRPRCVVVFGDTDSTLAAAIAGSFNNIAVAHVEAGARSGERDLPEERNRILVDEMSDLLFCSTEAHARNLAGRRGVFTVGDVMADVLFAKEKAIRAAIPAVDSDYAVLTLHRAGTADDPAAVARVLDAASRLGMPVHFPVHPRTKKSLGRLPVNVRETEPLPYVKFLGLVAGARLVLTDSGGLQKEAYLLGTPCITLRDATEWEETLAAGWNTLAGTDVRRIGMAARQPPRMDERYPVYGDGDAAKKIAERL